MDNYKNIALGEIPNDWEQKTLRDLVEIRSGTSPINFNFINGGKYPYFKVNDMNFCNKYLCNAALYFDKCNFTLMKKGMIVFPKRGAAIFTNKIAILEKDCFFDTNIMGLKVSSNVLNEFLYYYLAQMKLYEIADTSSVPQINNKHIEPLKMPLPSMNEQIKIASILSTVDNFIQNTDYLINSYTLLKKGLIQTLLTKGIGHKEFKKTPLGEIPLVWKIVELLDYVDVIKGISYKSSEYCNEDEGVNLINLKCVAKSGGFSKSGLKYFKGDFTKEDVIKDTDIIIANTDLTRAGDIIGCPIIIPDEYFKENTLITMDLSVLRIKDNSYNYNFLYYFLMSSCCRKYLKSYSRGSTVLHLDLKGVKKMKLPLPPIEEQNKISSILLLVDNLVDLYLIRRDGANILKKGLMQQLLTGKIRVKV